MSQREETHTIQARRKSTEAQLAKLLRDAKSVITIKIVKDAIFQAQISDFQPFVLDMLAALGHGDIEGLDNAAVQVIQDAWNYFPHRALGGSCPAELALTAPTDHRKRKR